MLAAGVQGCQDGLPLGFLDRFLDGRCANVNCETCGHCAEIAARAIRFEDGYAADAVAAHDDVLDEIVSGRLFSYLPARDGKGDPAEGPGEGHDR